MLTALLFLWLQQDLQKEIEKATEQDQATKEAAQQPAFTPAPASQPSTASAPAAPRSSLLNPALSVILDGNFGYYGINEGDFAQTGVAIAGDDPAQEGFSMQEIELAFTAAVDPYLEGALFLAIPNLDGIEVEEAYLVTTMLPFNLQLKGGSFRSQFGRNNGQHLHQQHFTRRPLMTAPLFGEDGFRGPGAQVSVLLPLPWFAAFYLESFSIGAPEDPAIVTTFGGGTRNDLSNLTYTAVLEQFFPLSESTSLLFGASFATGSAFECPMAPCAPARRSYLYGGDLYFRWKPSNVVQSYASLQWTTEYFARTISQGGPTEGALYTEPVLQFARRWLVGARLDVTGLPEDLLVPRRYGVAGSLTFTPSEFSRVRIYLQEIFGPNIGSATLVFLQTEISLGAHGAHPF